VETLEGNKVKLYVEVEEAEFDHDIDRAFKLIAKEVNLPGFRAGKAPRKVLEARIGIGAAREQALRDAVPQYLAKAVREHQVDLIATPEVEITDGAESGPVEFDATCEVRPVITLEGYGELRVELPSLEVTDDDLAEIHQGELERTATLTDAGRPAEAGDYLTMDLAATRDGEELSGLNTEDWGYELGQGWVTEDFDEHLTGASAGDELTFTSTPKGLDEPADFVVKVTAVQTKVVPELTDDWVADNIGEFDTVDEWNASLRESRADDKLNQARQRVVQAMNAALAELVTIDVPDAMVDADLNQRVQGIVQQFQAQGIDLGQWLAATGQGPDEFIESMRNRSRSSRTTSTPSTPAWRCSTARRPRTSARPTSRTKPSPNSPPRSASRRRSTGSCTTSTSSIPTATRSIATRCSATATTTITTTTTTTTNPTCCRRRPP
jgi:trigger factor